MVDEEKRTNEALDASKKYNTVVEEANDYIEHFDILETITNVGNDEVFTPRKTCDMMLDSLPEEVWHNPLYKWLNPATKNGIFEREIALRLDKGLENVITDKEERRKHILQNMIFSIGQTKFTSNVARRTLYYCSQANRKCDGLKAPDGHYVNGYSIGNGSWFDDEDGNVKTPCTDHDYVDSSGKQMPSSCKGDERKKYKCKYCGIAGDSKYNDANQREKYAYEFIHVNHLIIDRHLCNRFFGGNRKMKFDIIIGNPPYQLSDGGAQSSARPIYHLFINQAIALNPKYLCMIIPSRWMAGGKGLDDFRSSMLSDKHFKIMHMFLDSTQCFPYNDIRGGICYFVWDNAHNGKCSIFTHDADGGIEKTTRYLKEDNAKIDIFIKNEIQLSIVNKVLAKSEKSFSELVSARKPFGFSTDFMQNQEKFGFPKLLDEPVDDGYVIYGVDEHQKRIKKYMDKNYPIPKRTLLKDYKLFIPNAGGGGGKTLGEVKNAGILSKPILAGPNDLCSETFLTIGPFDNKEQRNNCFKYISTKFFRALVGIRKNTQHTTSDTYKFVPLLDFNKIWSDEELYERYGFSPEEIKYIEEGISKVEWDMNDYR